MERILQRILSTNIIASLCIVAATFILLGIFRKLVKAYISRNDPDRRLESMLRSMIRTVEVIVWTLVIMALLQMNGINITSLIAGVGVAGAIVGLAMQDLFKDIIMGFHIVSDKAFKYGDVVTINGYEGVVVSFTLLATQVRDLNSGNLVTICNRDISTTAVVCGVYDIDLPVSGAEDPEKVEALMKKIAGEIAAEKGFESCEYMGVQNFNGAQFIHKIRFKCSPAEKWPMWRRAMAHVCSNLQESGVRVPNQELDVRQKAE
ncbi:MAG: mechanosensitive ion channel family protein [Mobilibacterium timonense]|uniref:mechanosensitive ion channel family protein n=1 Tax=Mobilibacterium timonense TaxID=1871012 RepID=UPI00235533FD|nr:mechanosensitive ion channel family protein [Mobilibacterium timonense]MBM6989915.1 mechanosensitive ion channel family protein [Mobilibacterium timonense]